LKKNVILTILTYIICLNISYSQTNNIEMSVTLNTDTNTLNITQKTIFHNKSDSIRQTYC